MPFIEISFGERMFDKDAFIDAYSLPRTELIAEIEHIVATALTCIMDDGSRNIVQRSGFNVKVREISTAEGEHQEKDVEIKVAAIGFPDRMRNRSERGMCIREYMEGMFLGLTFGVWLDLKPDAVWSSD